MSSQRIAKLIESLKDCSYQGNQNSEVEIFRYVTENTFDACLYQRVENKQKFISHPMNS